MGKILRHTQAMYIPPPIAGTLLEPIALPSGACLQALRAFSRSLLQIGIFGMRTASNNRAMR